LRIRYTQAIFLITMLNWAPMFIVLMQTFLGVDVYRVFGITWLVVNVAIGLAILAIGIWLARTFGPRFAGTAFAQRFLRDLAGYNLNAASGFLAALAEFEKG
jgi:hypothetical protein